MIDSRVKICDKYWKLLQRNVATDRCSSAENAWFDKFIVESDSAIEAADVARTDWSLWSANALFTIKVDLKQSAEKSTFITVEATVKNVTTIQKQN